jgi:hypothetical protein
MTDGQLGVLPEHELIELMTDTNDQRQQVFQAGAQVTDVNEQGLLDFVLEQIRQEPNVADVNLPLGGGGGGGAMRFADGLFASRPESGLSGAALAISGGPVDSGGAVVRTNPAYDVVWPDDYYASPGEQVVPTPPSTVTPGTIPSTEGHAIPEPATVSLLALGVLGVVRTYARGQRNPA